MPAAAAVEPATPSEVARLTLAVLAEEEAQREAIEMMAGQPEAERFFDPGALITTASVVTACLLLLQTHFKIERDKDGKWTFRLEKLPTSDSLLKELMLKLLGLAGK